MQQLNFSDLRGGKLFCDQFDDIRLNDTERFIIGNHFDITLRNQHMGTAKILNVFTFPFCKISDAVSMRTYGKGAHYMAAVLKRFYDSPASPIMPNTKMVQIVLQYTYRNTETQRMLLEDWWHTKEEQRTDLIPQTKLEF